MSTLTIPSTVPLELWKVQYSTGNGNWHDWEEDYTPEDASASLVMAQKQFGNARLRLVHYKGKVIDERGSV